MLGYKSKCIHSAITSNESKVWTCEKCKSRIEIYTWLKNNNMQHSIELINSIKPTAWGFKIEKRDAFTYEM